MSGDKRFQREMEPLLVAQRIDTKYDFVSDFTVVNGASDYNLRTQQAAAFKNVSKAWLIIIWTTKDLTVKFNNVSNPPVDIKRAYSPMEFRNILEISNMFISNASGADATVSVMIV